jgi:hypothetical protein
MLAKLWDVRIFVLKNKGGWCGEQRPSHDNSNWVLIVTFFPINFGYDNLLLRFSSVAGSWSRRLDSVAGLVSPEAGSQSLDLWAQGLAQSLDSEFRGWGLSRWAPHLVLLSAWALPRYCCPLVSPPGTAIRWVSYPILLSAGSPTRYCCLGSALLLPWVALVLLPWVLNNQ